MGMPEGATWTYNDSRKELLEIYNIDDCISFVVSTKQSKEREREGCLTASWSTLMRANTHPDSAASRCFRSGCAWSHAADVHSGVTEALIERPGEVQLSSGFVEAQDKTICHYLAGRPRC